MSKKHVISVQQHLTDQQDAYADAIEAAAEKGRDDKAGYAQHRQKGIAPLHRLRTLTDLDGLEALEEDLDLPDEEPIAGRGLRNARPHKKRLAGLRGRETRARAWDEEE